MQMQGLESFLEMQGYITKNLLVICVFAPKGIIWIESGYKSLDVRTDDHLLQLGFSRSSSEDTLCAARGQ